MKKIFSRGKPLCVLSIALSVCPVVGANLIVNGDFENPVVTLDYEYLTSSNLDDWEIITSFRGVGLFNSGYSPVGSGMQSLQIEALGDSISQSFATIPGTPYRVSFDTSAYDDNVSSLKVSVGDYSSTFSGTEASYTRYTFDFSATSALSTLSFTKSGDSSSFPHLDDVSVVAVEAHGVPEVGASVWLLVIGATALAGFRRMQDGGQKASSR